MSSLNGLVSNAYTLNLVGPVKFLVYSSFLLYGYFFLNRWYLNGELSCKNMQKSGLPLAIIVFISSSSSLFYLQPKLRNIVCLGRFYKLWHPLSLDPWTKLEKLKNLSGKKKKPKGEPKKCSIHRENININISNIEFREKMGRLTGTALSRSRWLLYKSGRCLLAHIFPSISLQQLDHLQMLKVSCKQPWKCTIIIWYMCKF